MSFSLSDLPILGTEEKTSSHVPLFEVKNKIYVFECPVCKNRASNDSDMETLCTGPNWTDDHPLAIMKLIQVR